ncbi:MAG: hypothetical protein CTY19_12775 [Methylomonas sp.]|nr:MAG: hypothetical protein CTY19_12775 [Methylomonas sp.]
MSGKSGQKGFSVAGSLFSDRLLESVEGFNQRSLIHIFVRFMQILIMQAYPLGDTRRLPDPAEREANPGFDGWIESYRPWRWMPASRWA